MDSKSNAMRTFRVRFTGGSGWLVLITLLSLTVVLVPLALVALLERIELVEERRG